MAAAFDRGEDALARIAVALAKYLSNARAPTVIAEAMQILGGMGYVEETPMPLLYREAPLNAIWEGSGNVICLDILRTLARAPEAAAALLAEIEEAAGATPTFDTALRAFKSRIGTPPPEAEARAFAGEAAALLAASVLFRTAPGALAAGYAETRLGRGALTPGGVRGLDTGAILARLGPPD